MNGTKSAPLNPSFNGRVVKDDANDRIYITDDTNTPEALFGKDASGNIVVKVAMSGYNVLTATDEQLIFNSNQDTFKIAKKIPTTLPSFTTGSNGGNTLLTVPHGLSFIPIVNAYVQLYMISSISPEVIIASSYVSLPVLAGASSIYSSYYASTTNGGIQFIELISAVDDKNVYIQAATTAASVTYSSIPITIFCLQETAA